MTSTADEYPSVARLGRTASFLLNRFPHKYTGLQTNTHHAIRRTTGKPFGKFRTRRKKRTRTSKQETGLSIAEEQCELIGDACDSGRHGPRRAASVGAKAIAALQTLDTTGCFLLKYLNQAEGDTMTSQNGPKLRSQAWWDNSENPDMTALYLERFLNYGLTREELQSGRPIIGIAQTGNDLVPCNRHHLVLAERVKAGIRDGGGIPFEFPV